MIQIPEETKNYLINNIFTPSNIIFFVFILVLFYFIFVHPYIRERRLQKALKKKEVKQEVVDAKGPFFHTQLEQEYDKLIKPQTRKYKLKELQREFETEKNACYYELVRINKQGEELQKQYALTEAKMNSFQVKIDKINEELALEDMETFKYPNH